MNYLKLHSFSLSHIFYYATCFVQRNRTSLKTAEHSRSFHLTNLIDKSPVFVQQIIFATSKKDNASQHAVVGFNDLSLTFSLPHHY
jgi:hypothetical protein